MGGTVWVEPEGWNLRVEPEGWYLRDLTRNIELKE
jgi:hypothetical protein